MRFSALGESGRQVDGGRRFADAPLLVRDRDDFHRGTIWVRSSKVRRPSFSCQRRCSGSGSISVTSSSPGLDEPAVKNFEKEIALEIDIDRLGILIAAFGATAAERRFARADINVARQTAARAQSFHRDDEIARDAGEIAGAEFVERDSPGAALHDDVAAAQTRGVFA